jgi:uncharacterized protein YjiS (DUF1127 family)
VTTQTCKTGQSFNASTAGRLTEAIRAAFFQLNETVWTWRARIRSRGDLARFDDHILKDIGISRADVYRETSKRFWRE